MPAIYSVFFLLYLHIQTDIFIANMLTKKITDKITRLYGPDQADRVAEKLSAIIDRYDFLQKADAPDFLDERDVFLITYADTLHQPGFKPLKSLHQFVHHRLRDLISIIHILPFCPYSSDDGFSVIDYRQVDPHNGDWSHIMRLGEDFDLCFDLVLNHVSAQSRYFRGFLAGAPQYQDYFIELDEHTDTSGVVRPRALPLLHKYHGKAGDKWCWTTFSEDQLDFNFQNPDVLLEMLDILLFYVSQGARMIRLDAIAYLWKILGTSCVHLPQTHLVVQLMRDTFDVVAPHALLLSETNFPHEDNISYFGDGRNEAQVAYNFPLPPLVLYTLVTGNAEPLTRWARSIKPISDRATFLNFTASHDGVGVRPAATVLDELEFQKLVDRTTDHGGKVSYKNDQNGKPIPYELNINYYDALNNPNDPYGDEDLDIRRFLLSQSIALVFQGIPGIYIHSLIGSRNWKDGPRLTNMPRSINREKIELDLLEQQLLDDGSRRAKVFSRYTDMIHKRRAESVFHPLARQTVLDLGEAIFALARISDDGNEIIIALHNVTCEPISLTIEPGLWKEKFDLSLPARAGLTDLISGTIIELDSSGSHYSVQLAPYQFAWLKTT